MSRIYVGSPTRTLFHLIVTISVHYARLKTELLKIYSENVRIHRVSIRSAGGSVGNGTPLARGKLLRIHACPAYLPKTAVS